MERYRECRTVPACIKSNAPSIAVITKQYGFEFAKDYIAGWIINLAAFLNIKSEYTDAQVDMTAELIVTEFPNITIADINYIFRAAKMGKYGPLYGRLDGQVVLSWFTQYFEDRCNAAAELSIQEANSMSGPSLDSDKRVKDIVYRLLDRGPEKK